LRDESSTGFEVLDGTVDEYDVDPAGIDAKEESSGSEKDDSFGIQTF